MDLFIFKTDGEKFTSTNKKTLHLIFKLLMNLAHLWEIVERLWFFKITVWASVKNLTAQIDGIKFHFKTELFRLHESKSNNFKRVNFAGNCSNTFKTREDIYDGYRTEFLVNKIFLKIFHNSASYNQSWNVLFIRLVSRQEQDPVVPHVWIIFLTLRFSFNRCLSRSV